MTSLFALIVISMFIEAFISYLQTIWVEGRIQWQIVIAFFLAIAICFDTGINFLAIVGLTEQWPVVGIIATAVVVCRGSNYLFEFYKNLAGWRKKTQEDVALAAKKKKEKEEEIKKSINFID